MLLYLATFNGRTKGAIGIFHRCGPIEVSGETREEARLKIYDTHEHLSDVHMVCVTKGPDGTYRCFGCKLVMPAAHPKGCAYG